MATEWLKPRIITQYPEAGAENIHLRWDDSNDYAGLKSTNGTTVGTLGALIHISRSPKPDISSKTYYLQLSGFNFTTLPELPSGIEVEISAKRAGRIIDDTVSLTYDGKLLGDNQANLNLDLTKVYGGENSQWGLSSISSELIQDPTFGVTVRFKSHPQWPHKDPMDLVSVRMRIH